MTLQNIKPTKKYFAFTNDIFYFEYTEDKLVYKKYNMDFRWYCPACAKIPECKNYCGYSICSLRCYSNDYTIKCPRNHKLNMYLYLKNNNCSMKHVIHIYLIHIIFATARIYIQSKARSEDKNKWLKKRQFFHNDWSPVLDTEFLEAIWDTVLEKYHTIADANTSYFSIICDCDEGNNEFDSIFEKGKGSKIAQFCKKMIEIDNYAARPILNRAIKKGVTEIREEYDEILGMNIKIKIKGVVDVNSLILEELDEAFMDIIIADYVESIKHKQKVIIQIDTDDPPDGTERANSPTLGTA